MSPPPLPAAAPCLSVPHLPPPPHPLQTQQAKGGAGWLDKLCEPERAALREHCSTLGIPLDGMIRVYQKRLMQERLRGLIIPWADIELGERIGRGATGGWAGGCSRQMQLSATGGWAGRRVQL